MLRLPAARTHIHRPVLYWEQTLLQRGFTDAQENKRRLRYRALEAKLARRREERMRALAAALASAAEKDKVMQYRSRLVVWLTS